MTKVYSKALGRSIEISRIIAHIKGSPSGPTVIFVGGIHGNEPSGVFALQKVFDDIRSSNMRVYGNIYAIGGNLWALERGVRYHKEDLNRLWSNEKMLHLGREQTEFENEDQQQQQSILKTLNDILENDQGPFYFIDLHTTSGETIPFLTVNDSMLNRNFTMQYPLPIVLGIEEYLDGPLLSYINELGYVAFGFEGGQHDDLSSIENHIAFVYLSLVYAGCLERSDFDFEHQFEVLAKSSINSREIYEIFYRFEIKPEEEFTMHPGFLNFQEVKKGTPLAICNNQEIIATLNSRIFMPLYQSQGSDGFFAIRKIPSIFLKASAWLRKIKFDHLLPILPGVRWSDRLKNELVVNKKIAWFFAKQLFHLLGYRSKKFNKTHLIVRNRESASKNHDYQSESWYM
jgi:predicted deacylase